MSDFNLSEPNDGTTTRDPYELLQIFESAEDLPTLPEIAVRLQQVVDDPHSDAKDVAKIIQDDPAIATKVLKVVNSVFYAPRGRMAITELQPAVARLGFVAVVNIVLSTSVFQAFGRVQQPVFDRREFWRHSVCVGIASAVLHDYLKAKADRPISRDAVHLAGIVHDMGKILFERYANPEFHTAIQNAREQDLPTLKEECRYLGFGHDEAGGWLAKKWKIDPAIQAVIRWHHDPISCPEEELTKLVKLVHMADYICHSQNLGDSGNPNPMYDERVREELHLTEEKIMELMEMVEVEAANSEILLSLAD
jgi:HD-like signal output (HDOD) protein